MSGPTRFRLVPLIFPEAHLVDNSGEMEWNMFGGGFPIYIACLQNVSEHIWRYLSGIYMTCTQNRTSEL